MSRKRLSDRERDEKRRQWAEHAEKKRQKARPRLAIDWARVPDAESEVIAVAPIHADRAERILREAGLTCWRLGKLAEACWRLEHKER